MTMSTFGRPGPVTRVMAAAMTLLMLTGCANFASVKDLRFTQDHRLVISSPNNREKVTLPLTVRWTMKDFVSRPPGTTTDPGEGYFAVLVDRYPMPPGGTLKDIVDTGECDRDPECPNADLLAYSYATYLTGETSISIPSMPKGDGTDSHYAVIILIDPTGHRISDSSWTISFVVHDKDKGKGGTP